MTSPSVELGAEDVDELEIVELEEQISPFEWACACSTTCNCTTTSCVAWDLDDQAAAPVDAPAPAAN